MELKYEVISTSFSGIFGFNRTFMELKFFSCSAMSPSSTGFNRTFMELKSATAAEKERTKAVLIVPLWN